MPSSPVILGFDTSAAHCAAALLSGGTIIAQHSVDMKRGQAERLMPLLENLLAQCGHSWQDLDAIAVGTGPGNFTGIRISVSAARGLALALGIPAVGVTNFEVISHDQTLLHIPAVPAPRDQFYAILPGKGAVLAAKSELDQQVAPVILPPKSADIAANIARVAALRYTHAPIAPTPFYLRAADAAPPRDIAPLILD